MPIIPDKEPVTVVDNIPANTEKYYPNETGMDLRRDATITGGYVDTHVNQQFDLQYYLEVRRQGGSWTSLIRPLGKEFIAGNGATIDLKLRKELPMGSRLRVRVVNEDLDYAYDANMALNIDYEMETVVEGFLSKLFGGTQ